MSVKKSHKRFKIVLISIFTLLLILVSGCSIYLADYSKALPEATDYLSRQGSVTVTEIDEGLFLDGEGTDYAYIFYPGAKIEYTAYLPLLYDLAESGVDVFLVRMPFNLAIFGSSKAGGILSSYQYDHWYIGGHSLGGAMAASYAASLVNAGNVSIDGLILLAAYPTKDLSESDLRVLTIYGSEDHVLNMSRLESGRAYMPQDAQYVKIEGGNHAQFGDYGTQVGDGVATISATEQWQLTVEKIAEWVFGGSDAT